MLTVAFQLDELISLFLEKRNLELTTRLIHENAVLRREVDEHKKLLSKLELENKVPQVTFSYYTCDMSLVLIL